MHMPASETPCVAAVVYVLVQSYYGAALCVCWAPDGALVASGGEDDLVTAYSVAERQVGDYMHIYVCVYLLCITLLSSVSTTNSYQVDNCINYN